MMVKIKANWAQPIQDEGLDERMDIVRALVSIGLKSYGERLDAALWPLVASGVPTRSIALHHQGDMTYVALDGERVFEVPLLVSG